MGSTSRSPDEYYRDKYTHGKEIYRSYHHEILNWLPDDPSLVLDLGSGTGKLAAAISERNHSVLRTDRSLRALRKAQDRSVPGLQLDLNEPLPFNDDRFPFVVCCDVLEHVTEPNRFLEEVLRVLSPGGKLLLAVPNSSHLFYRLLYLLGYLPEDLQIPGHRHFFSYDSLRRLMASTKLTVERHYGRNLYLAIKENWIPSALQPHVEPLLETVGFHKEFAYSHDQHLWILTEITSALNPIFADAMIFVLQKESP